MARPSRFTLTAGQGVFPCTTRKSIRPFRPPLVLRLPACKLGGAETLNLWIARIGIAGLYQHQPISVAKQTIPNRIGAADSRPLPRRAELQRYGLGSSDFGQHSGQDGEGVANRSFKPI